VNEQIIHTEAELRDTISKVLDRNIFRIVSRDDRSPQSRSDITIAAKVEGHTATFVAECKLNPHNLSPGAGRSVRHWEQTPLARHRPPFGVACRAVSSKRLSPSCLDLNGRIWIKVPGLVIDRNIPNASVRYRLAKSEIRFFSPKSTRLARAHLATRIGYGASRIWPNSPDSVRVLSRAC